MSQTVTAHRYRWKDLDQDHPIAHLSRRRVIGEQAMLSEIRLEAGCTVPSHRHANEQFACVLSGTMRFGLGEEGTAEHREVTLTGGEVLHLPSNMPHSAHAVEDSLVLDVFAPPSEGTGIDTFH